MVPPVHLSHSLESQQQDGEFPKASEGFVKTAHIKSMHQYQTMHRESLENPDQFWADIARGLYMKQPWDDGKFIDYNFDVSKGEPFVKMMEGAKTNITYNCIDRWMMDTDGPEVDGVKKSKRAFKYRYYWEGNYWDEPTNDYSELTWETLQTVVNKCANIMKSKGVEKGDHVVLYMPTVFQLPVAMLGLAKIGAVSVVVPCGMNPEGLAQRVVDCKAQLIVTVDGFWRGTQLIKAKELVDQAVALCREQKHDVNLTIVVSHLSPHPGTPAPEPHDQLIARRPCYFLNPPFNEEQDEWWSTGFGDADASCEPTWMDPNDPLFVLYTYGSSDKLRRVVHTVGGFQLYAYATFKHLMDYQSADNRLQHRVAKETDVDEKIFWSTHDMATIQGITYGVFGPLLHGGTILQFEGIPTHPDPGRYWEIIKTYKVDKVFLTPSDLRAVMAYDHWGYRTAWGEPESLTLLAVSGEPLSVRAHKWLYGSVGGGHCSLVDLYATAEAGGALLSCFPGATVMKPGSVGVPYFGVDVALLDRDGNELSGATTGYLCVTRPWPGMAASVCSPGSDSFSRFPGYFFTGDRARRDEDGYYYVEGNEEDRLITDSGRSTIAPYEVEATINEHESVFDSAVVVATDGSTVAFLHCDWEFEIDQSFKANLLTSVAGRFDGLQIAKIIRVASIPQLMDGRVARRVLRKLAANTTKMPEQADLANLSPDSVKVIEGIISS